MLEYRNTKLAVNEAKAWDEALTAGVAQAKNYANIADAVADLGSADQIKATFTGFQKYLYDDAVA